MSLLLLMEGGEDIAPFSAMTSLCMPSNLSQLWLCMYLLLSHMHVQGSTEMTAQALPEITRLLTNRDPSIVLEASRLVLELSKKEASCQAIINNGGMVSTVIQVMAGTGNADMQKSLAGTLHNLSNDR